MKRKMIFFAVAAALLLSACAADRTEAQPEPTPEEPAIKEFVPGNTDGNEYINDFLALGFRLPEAWSFASDEEMEKIINDGSLIVRNDLAMDDFPENTAFYEFYAHSDGGDASVIMTVENLSAHEGGKLTTVRQFVTELSEKYAGISSIAYEIGEIYQKTIAEKEFLILPVSVPKPELFQRNCVARTEGYMLSISMTAHSEEELDELESCLFKH